MEKILNAWRSQDSYFELTALLRQRRTALVNGLPLLPRAALAAALYSDLPYPLLLLAATEEEAAALTDNILPFLSERVAHFPVLELLPFEVYAHNIELVAARISVLSRLARGEKLLVVSSVNAVTRRLPPPEVFLQQHLRLKPRQIIAPERLADRLADMGYERAALTELPGTFSQRGSIVDVFPVAEARPLRVEFFDDEVESIRWFDPAGQRSAEQVTEPTLSPARELPVDDTARRRAEQLLATEYAQTYASLRGPAKKELEKTYAPLLEYLRERIWDNGMEALTSYFYPEAGSIFAYLGQGVTLLSEPDAIRQTALELTDERAGRYFDLLDSGRLLPSFYFNFLSYDELARDFSRQRLLLLSQLGLSSSSSSPAREYAVAAHELPAYAADPEGFAKDLRNFVNSGYSVALTASSDVRIERMEEILRENGCPPARLLKAGFTAGFESPALKMAVITENELFARRGKKHRRRLYQGGDKIAHFMDLRVGDYVVHITQGIGQYMGVERLTIGDIGRDYLLIRYAGEDKLYLPVDQLDLIQKYVGSDSGAPKVHKMGGGEWNRVKSKARAAVQEMTDELLQLYAVREQTLGHAFAPDTEWQREFEDAFPYAETPDQLTATEEIKRDMESERVMDRLLCGDVGYGKTEVALRAAFKAVMDGKQVALLVPTTVLAQQHFRTMRERLHSFPVQSGCLSRFNTPREQKETLSRLASGEVDMVVGTHRLLSADVRFHDLGLLIVDEEQRFGVAHKEKIKALRTQVDVLTLSATPIPRTLHMSLVGMRDMSLISTPPEARFPVQTYVVEYHPRLIRDAIARELSRGGQVYFVHNRVFDIHEAAEELRRLLPGARVAVGHGQMRERELEQVMLDFVAGAADVLVCTTIIESGLDIPNVNTLIVGDADMFGLAQLYQLRGRVGRAERQAFAYFTYRRDAIMNEVAKKRLIAIRDFTELGSGFKIAMRDLELRGAGNLLGPEQHGHIAAVGFDLYCRMLEEEIARARGAAPVAPAVATQIDLALDAFIPDSFVADSVLKVELYKRLAAAASLAEVDDLAAELSDRYGPPPPQVENLLLIGKIKVLCRQLSVVAVTQKTDVIELKFAETHPVKGEHLVVLLAKWEKRLVFSEKKGFAVLVRTSDIKTDIVGVELLLRILSELAREVLAAAPKEA